MKLDQMEFDETLNEIHEWIVEHRTKCTDLRANLSFKDDNRKRLYQLKCFYNDLNVKQTILQTLKEKFAVNDKFFSVESSFNEFSHELKNQIHSFEEFLRIQILIEDNKQLLMEKLKFLMDRLSLCTKTDCDFDTLKSRLKKIEVRFQEQKKTNTTFIKIDILGI